MQAGGDKEDKSQLICGFGQNLRFPRFGQNPQLGGIGQKWENAPHCHTQGPHAYQSYHNLVINASMHWKHTDVN